jgi:hypothetical protein
MENLYIGFMALIPQAYVVTFRMDYFTKVPEELFVAMPNIETLTLTELVCQVGFCCQTRRDHMPTRTSSLRFDPYTWTGEANADWKALTTYLVHQTSCGRLISLEVFSDSRMPSEVMEEIRGLVETFTIEFG